MTGATSSAARADLTKHPEPPRWERAVATVRLRLRAHRFGPDTDLIAVIVGAAILIVLAASIVVTVALFPYTGQVTHTLDLRHGI